mgnify:CR=1 FL=1
MNPRVIKAIPNDDYSLRLTFSNGEIGVFDVSPYLEKGIFKELKEPSYFKSVKACMGTVQWPHEQDFCPDTLYEESKRQTSRLTPVAVDAARTAPL